MTNRWQKMEYSDKVVIYLRVVVYDPFFSLNKYLSISHFMLDAVQSV